MLSRIRSGNHYLSLEGTAAKMWLSSVADRRIAPPADIYGELRISGRQTCGKGRVDSTCFQVFMDFYGSARKGLFRFDGLQFEQYEPSAGVTLPSQNFFRRKRTT